MSAPQQAAHSQNTAPTQGQNMDLTQSQNTAPTQSQNMDPTQSQNTAPTANRSDTAGWVVGLSSFAGILMIITGIFGAIEGVVALFRNEVYVAGLRYVFAFDVTTWGWIHLVVGIVVAAAGFAVMSGRLWGRIIGIGLALLSMLTNFLFIPYYPVWSLLIITLDIFVIYALCLYNRSAAAA
jgi:hypothetical protein